MQDDARLLRKPKKKPYKRKRYSKPVKRKTQRQRGDAAAWRSEQAERRHTKKHKSRYRSYTPSSYMSPALWRKYGWGDDHSNRYKGDRTPSKPKIKPKVKPKTSKSKSPGSGTGRSRTTNVSSTYSGTKAPAAAKPKPPAKPKVVPQTVRITPNFDVLEHYKSQATLGSDRVGGGISRGYWDSSSFDSEVNEFGISPDEYADSLESDDTLPIDSILASNGFFDASSDLESITTFTERYVETIPVMDAEINLPNTGGYTSIQVRIIET